MRWKLLPAAESILALNTPEERADTKRKMLLDLASRPGFQVFLTAIQGMDSDTHDKLMSGTITADYYRGFQMALEQIRQELFSSMSEADLGDSANHDERDEPLMSYISPFIE